MKLKNLIFAIGGIAFFAIAMVFFVIPMIPSFPFLVLSSLCFARSSDKLNRWFLQTKIYKEVLAPFKEGKGMFLRTKVKIMISLTLVLVFGFFAMGEIWIGRIILLLVWVFHFLYFFFKVKTREE